MIVENQTKTEILQETCGQQDFFSTLGKNLQELERF